MSDGENQSNNANSFSTEIDIAQFADDIYNVKGDINNYISIFNARKNDDFPKQLEKMRERLEEKKIEFYEATQRRGFNSKDATNIANDAAIYRDQIEALKTLIAMDTSLPTIVSSRYDKETFKEVFSRFRQVNENTKRKEQELRTIEQKRLDIESAERRQREEQWEKLVKEKQEYDSKWWRRFSRWLDD